MIEHATWCIYEALRWNGRPRKAMGRKGILSIPVSSRCNCGAIQRDRQEKRRRALERKQRTA
jgi:hypothetical protein